ncbi:MAG: hypothetical protein JKY93_07535, partial [Gammaproteobacteria bacterium]|nr:hypothetical protein [Gammaproteobacteria bacterium]
MQQPAAIHLLEPVQPSREFKSVGRDQETPEKPVEFLNFLAEQLLAGEDESSQVIEITAETISAELSLDVEAGVIL